MLVRPPRSTRTYPPFPYTTLCRSDDDRVPGLGIGHYRVRVRAAAGLDLADLDRPRRIADVEDAQAPEPLWARILGYTPMAAIDPAAGLLDRHDEDVAGDRHVPLSTRADDRDRKSVV